MTTLPAGQVFTVCKRLSHTHTNFLPDLSTTILHSLPYTTIQHNQKVVYTQSLTEIKSIRKTATKADLYTYSTIPKVGVIIGWEGTKTSGFLPWRSIRVSWMNTSADATPTSLSSSTKTPPSTQDTRADKSKEEGELVNLWELSPFNRDELIDLVYPTSDDATGKTESDSTAAIRKSVSSKEVPLNKGDASAAAADVAGEGMGEELSGTGTGQRSTSAAVVAAKKSSKK